MNTKIDALHSPAGSAPRQAAFTLIELLTVLAIIGILAAILFPVISKARQAAQQSACASNQRQIGIALAAYIADHKGHLPGYDSIPWQSGSTTYSSYGLGSSASATWYMLNGIPTTGISSQLMDYMNLSRTTRTGTGSTQGVSTIFLCPANPSHPTSASDTNYASNYYLAPTVRTAAGITNHPFGLSSTNTRALAFNQISNPSTAPVLFDLDNAVRTLLGVAAANYAPATCVHGSSRNVLYFDGHVATVAAGTNPLEHL